jgi:hypothetical protein
MAEIRPVDNARRLHPILPRIPGQPDKLGVGDELDPSCITAHEYPTQTSRFGWFYLPGQHIPSPTADSHRRMPVSPPAEYECQLEVITVCDSKFI